ncbi:hypothetical protein ACIP93_37380 [Streptomyces sp. NPDC088745]|uniref:hypothetical protein n=1 Tax=Streptomyces sp. NPDC088745 TaxID=3365884 RepID=UPI00381A0735
MSRTRTLTLHTLLCQACGGLSPLYAASDRTFVCADCDSRVTTEDAEWRLEGHEVWSVHPTGELGYAESPVIVAAHTVDTVRLYLAADPESADETAEFRTLRVLLSMGCDTVELGLDVPQESRLRCPKCRTGEVSLTCRQWCHCTECDWGGMEYEALYYGDSYQQ